MIYDVIVIGAGTGGLSAALKLSCAGKKVLVLEKQTQPGGFATMFGRRGFIFESSVHCIDGLSEAGEVREFLKETGVEDALEFIELKDFARIIYPEHDFVADFNGDNYIAFLKKTFPHETGGIDRLFGECDIFYRQFDRFSFSNLPLWLRLALSPFFYPAIVKLSLITLNQFMGRYISDEKLKAFISDIWGFVGLAPSRVSAFYFLVVFRGYYLRSTCQIKGGSARLFRAMAERIKEKGSEVRYSTTVEKILTKGEKGLKSVITDKKEEFRAKVIISNANPIDTLTKFLDDGQLREGYRRQLGELEKSLSAFQVYLGLKAPAKELGMDHAMFLIRKTYNQEDNFNYYVNEDYENCPLSLVDHAQIDPTLVPAGKGSLIVMAFDKYLNWSSLNEEDYKTKKIELANKLIARAEKYLPGLSSYIEVMEVATPRTMASYGCAPEGAIYGFAQTVNQASINRLTQKTKVKGLILSGGWTRPGGGIHACFVSGIEAARLALRHF